MSEASRSDSPPSAQPDRIVIETRGLRKRYGDLQAVDGVDLRIPRGEVFALLGPNGAGKSTTVEMLAGIRTPSSGTVRVFGEDPAAAPPAWRARVGVVAQTGGDIDRFTSREMLRHFASLYPRSRPVEEVLEACGLSDRADVRVRRLSGGQRRRLDVALGIVGRPELLFLDEPTTGFDPVARHEFWSLVERVRDEGTTIVLTTHYMEEAERLSDRVGVIVAGRLASIAPTGQLGGPDVRTPRVGWLERGEPKEARTPEPGRFVAGLVERLGEPEGLVVHRPTLEDVYLELIGGGGAEPRESGRAAA